MKNHESMSQESQTDDKWSELEELGKQGFDESKPLAALSARKREILAAEMGEQREAFARRKQERLKEQRTQEIFERDLNSKLLTVDQMETEVLSGNPEIRKTIFPFGDAEIPIYHLEGIPFALLSTTIDYRKANKSGEIGTETYQDLMKNPAIWAERRDQAEQANGFGTRAGNARGDVISTSYSNSEHNIDTYVPGTLTYGFEHVDADSVITVNNSDGGTPNMAGSNRSNVGDYHIIDTLEGPMQTEYYNEIPLRRYSDNGKPKLPDYIIVRDGNFTPAVFRHAKYFNIPVIHIDSATYEQKARQKGEIILDSVSEQDNYLEMEEKLSELLSMSTFKRRLYPRINQIGRARDFPHLSENATPLEAKCLEVAELELAKRIDFIKDSLTEITKSIEDSTAAGLPAPRNIPPLDGLFIEFIDTQNNKTRHKDSDSDGCPMYGTDGLINCNQIDILFYLKDNPMPQSLKVYDGERTNQPDPFITEGHADSSYYKALEPAVLKYIEAFRKNRDLTYQHYE